MSIFNGVGTALVTPFDEKNEVDFDALGKMIDFQLKSGINAIVVCGTTGEAATLSEEEKIAIISFAVKETKNKAKIIVGAGGNNTKDVISFTKQVQDIGVDALLCVTPYYNKTTQEGIFQHYLAVCNATFLPVMVYNVPSRTGLNIQPETLLRLSEIPNIVAIKEASGNMAQAVEMLSLCGNKVDFYSGNDELSVPMYSIGGKGTVSVLSNVMPEETVLMANAYFAGETAMAGCLQTRLMPIIKCLFSAVNPIPVKYVCSKMGFCRENVRLPLFSLGKKEKMFIDECIEKYIPINKGKLYN